MADWIIKVENLGKRYRIDPGRESRRYITLRETVTTGFKNLLPGRAERRSGDLWVLRDVSFEIGQGEIVAVLGRNGAGKSTLLRIISRITPPTLGKVRLRGRSSSLLEVGAGFHPELTGRENIYLNGAILGMGKREIDGKIEAILDFANLKKFADLPIKRFSSGMQVRLAFAIAAHLIPEIIIMDEVLAIGDIAFQKRCIAKIKASASAGRAVLLVSHQVDLISDLCTRAIFLDSGRCRADGPISQVIRLYQASVEKLGGPREDNLSEMFDIAGPAVNRT
jgi:lipopolysaccharide transport system ATP-binding protein